jgi:ketol-acid reductoisomerase
MTAIYYEQDGDLNVLIGKTISIIGYGGLGRSVALNLRDSGISVWVSADSEDQEQAVADGFTVLTHSVAAARADILFLATRDEIMTNIYMRDVAPNLKNGDTLIVGSAYNVAFGFVEPPPFVDVCVIAPRISGAAIRNKFTSGAGYLSFVSVWQDASRHAWDMLLGIARAMGALRAGAVEVTIQQEAEIALFVQQAILPAFYNIALTAARLLMREGYPAEAILSDLYLSGKFTDYMKQASTSGLLHALRQTPMTSQYGTLSRLDRFNEMKLERLMEITLDDIRNGNFAQEWAEEFADGHPRLDKLLKKEATVTLDIWELEQQTLDLLMPDNRFARKDE